MLNIDINVIVSCGKQVFSVGSVALVCDKDYSFKAGGKCLKKTHAQTIACSKSHDKVFTNESDNTGEIAWFIKSEHIRINNCIMITGWVHRR